MLAAGDTFRAAAVEQLEVWAQRAEVGFVKGDLGADSAAVAFEAVAAARRERADVVLIDTAGRLHTQDNLMAELAKVRRVIAKQIPERAARDAAHRRRHDGPERAAPGQAVLRDGRRLRDRAHQARRDRQGRDRARDRLTSSGSR